MAQYNPSDVTYSVVAETTPGTTPNDAALLSIDYIPGTMPTYTSDFIESNTLKPSRAAGGARKVNYHVDGGLKVHFKRDDAIELLLSSALSAAWVQAGAAGTSGDTLTAGTTDTSLTILKTFGGSTPLYQRFTGCQVNSFKLAVDASGNAEADFGIIGMGRSTTNAPGTPTVAAASTHLSLAGLDVTNITIAGMTGLHFRSLELNVTHNREAKDVFGQNSALGIGTSGNRKVTLTLSFYREDSQPETVLTGDAAVAVSFQIGSGTDGYTFSLPAANYAVPQDAQDGSKALVTLEFTAAGDATNHDLIVTRL